MNSITSTITYDNNVHTHDRDEWQRRSNPWTAEIRYKRRKMTIPFWTGSLAGEPETWDVAYCLLSDAQCVHWGESFEDFCSNLGYDSDSMKAHATYQQVIKQTESLKRIMGDDFEHFVGLDEDELKRRCR